MEFLEINRLFVEYYRGIVAKTILRRNTYTRFKHIWMKDGDVVAAEKQVNDINISP